MKTLPLSLSISLLVTTSCSGSGGGTDDPVATGVTTSSSGSTTTTTGGPGTDTSDPTGNDSSTGGASGGSTSSGGGTGAVFLEDPDGGGVGVECDVWTQDCGEGEKCMPWANDGGNAWNATKCVPVDDNPKQVGDVCTVEGSGVSGIDDCALGAMCWNVDPELGTGTCIEICSVGPANPTCSDPNTLCAIFNDGVLPVCLTKCNPLLGECQDREVCRPDYESGVFVCSNDASGEAGQYTDPCEYGNACDPGLFCANPANVPGCNSGGCCSPFCDVTDPNATASCPGSAQGQECIAWYDAGTAPPGLEDVGFCGIPM